MNIADRILSKQDRDGMLRRSLERIIQLYTDKSHFVYELLQNAEDAGAHSIRFVQYADRLEVMHDGHPFTTENLQGLCDIGKSDKVNDLNQIGEFGVGFKSVFGICDTVRLYSNPGKENISNDCQPFAVEIQDFTRPVDIEMVEFSHSYTTLFVFPYSVGFQFSGFKSTKLLNETLTKRLKNLGVTTLLFMRNLNLIEYEVKIPGHEAQGQYLLDMQPQNDHCTLVSAIEMEDKETDESLSFIKFTMPIDSAVSNRTIDIAFAFSTDKQGRITFQKAKNPYISVYFPTETESKLDFIVQGPFRTTPNRSSVPADDDENIALAEKTAKLLRRSILELKQMGLLDLSLINILPLDEDRFYVYSLFEPLFHETLDLLQTERVLPTKDGSYVDAEHALLARSKELADLLPNDLISELYDDGEHYEWLPISLTETSPLKDVYYYCRDQLEIEVIRPEDLRSHFNNNRSFLPKRSFEWLVQMYKLYETVPNIFSETNYRNILDAVIVKTASNRFVAPYRKGEKSSGYIPNVYLPSKRIIATDIEIVHPQLYAKCESFFKKALHLQAPDEYAFFVKSLEKRYGSDGYIPDYEEHIQDVQAVARYLSNPEYEDDIRRILPKAFSVKCKTNKGSEWVHPLSGRKILFPQSENGLMLELYYKGIDDTICFVDYDMYQSAGITYDTLRKLGVTDKIITGENRTFGEYPSGRSGRQPEWRASGQFLWKFSIDKVEEAVCYIEAHPHSKDSLIKSQVIFRILLQYAPRLHGDIYISGNTIPNKYGEHADIIRLLNQDGFFYRLTSWNGRWLYTESQELVSHKSISKHDLNKSLYGKVSLDSEIYDLLGFKKGKVDQLEAVVKDYDALPDEKKQSYFEIELQRRYGLTIDQMNQTYGVGHGTTQITTDEDEEFEFPTGNIKNWDALKKHAAQILSYANPVEYEFVVRHIRVSRPQDDIRAYLMNMYRVNASYRFACQLCHLPTSSFESCQLEQKPDFELDPLNLCLCPSCAAKFRLFRNDEAKVTRLLENIMDLTESDISGDDHVSVAVQDFDFWFTQTHIAEILELLKLKKQADETKKKSSSIGQPLGITTVQKKPTVPQKTGAEIAAKQEPTNSKVADPIEEEPESEVKVYKRLIGKRIYHKTKKAYAKVVDCTDQYIILNFESGDKAGQNVQYGLAVCISNQLIQPVD